MYYVYILKSQKDNSLYIGMTNNLKRRMQEHNSAGLKFTTSKRPYRIIWYSAFPSREKAHSFEQYLKSGSRKAFLKKRLT